MTPGTQSPAEQDQTVLLAVYQAALDEYRFNVKLAWDRTKFFLITNSALITGGIGLFALAGSNAAIALFLILYFTVAIIISLLGLEAVAVGKKYYRESIIKKTLIEQRLGLLEPISEYTSHLGNRANLSIAVTSTQQDSARILGPEKGDDLDTDRPIHPRTVVGYTRNIFRAMIFVEILGALVAALVFGDLITNKLLNPD